MIDAVLVFTCGLVVGNFINVIGVLKNQSFHSKRIEELEKKVNEVLNHLKK